MAYKEKVIKSKDRDTEVCGVTTGHPVRVIHNRFTRHYLQCERNGMSKEELEQLGKGRYPAAAVQGDVEEGSVMAGQICGLVNKIEPAADIVADILKSARQVKQQIGGIIC